MGDGPDKTKLHGPTHEGKGKRVVNPDGSFKHRTPNMLAMAIIRRKLFGGDADRMAEELGSQRSTVFNWFRGQTDPEAFFFELLYENFGVKPEDLFTLDRSALYYEGGRIGPEEPDFEFVKRAMRGAIKECDPKLADRLLL